MKKILPVLLLTVLTAQGFVACGESEGGEPKALGAAGGSEEGGAGQGGAEGLSAGTSNSESGEHAGGSAAGGAAGAASGSGGVESGASGNAGAGGDTAGALGTGEAGANPQAGGGTGGGGSSGLGGKGGTGGGITLPFLGDGGLGGAINACLECVTAQCPTALDCLNDSACVSAVMCGATTCGEPNTVSGGQCWLACFNGQTAAALSVLGAFTCVTGTCGTNCENLADLFVP